MNAKIVGLITFILVYLALQGCEAGYYNTPKETKPFKPITGYPVPSPLVDGTGAKLTQSEAKALTGCLEKSRSVESDDACIKDTEDAINKRLGKKPTNTPTK